MMRGEEHIEIEVVACWPGIRSMNARIDPVESQLPSPATDLLFRRISSPVSSRFSSSPLRLPADSINRDGPADHRSVFSSSDAANGSRKVPL
jgi:hypothetical protein